MRRYVLLGLWAVAVAFTITVLYFFYPFFLMVGYNSATNLFTRAEAPVAVEGADLTDNGPGSVLAATTMPEVMRRLDAPDMVAARVVYQSTNGDTKEPTVVSGSVFTPTGEAPEGGWPVVAFGHGTVGINPECGPSLSPTLQNLLLSVKELIKRGYAVALPDYQGLGSKGVHPYGDSRTAGLNLIDSVRALRHTFGDVSTKWAALGDSQGGGAAWAADEQAAKYAPELDLVAAAATSPAADITGLVDKAADGTLTPEQRGVMQAIVESQARLHSDFDVNLYRAGAAAQYWNVLSQCSAESAYKRASAMKKVGPRDFIPKNPAATNRLRAALEDWALPQQPLSAPLYVWYGGKDPFIDAPWTKAALERACTLGGSITIGFDPEGGHNPSDAVAVLNWVADRFAGKPASNDCPAR